jgi:hypothetical protein
MTTMAADHREHHPPGVITPHPRELENRLGNNQGGKMTTEPRYDRAPDGESAVSGWAIGAMTFAGTLMIITGIFQMIAGLVAIFDDEFYLVTANYTFDLDASAWGWVHLIIGILVVFTGSSLLARRLWAGVATIMLASLSAIVNFFFIPYYPFWSLLVIALDIWVIWAVTRPGAVRT